MAGAVHLKVGVEKARTCFPLAFIPECAFSVNLSLMNTG